MFTACIHLLLSVMTINAGSKPVPANMKPIAMPSLIPLPTSLPPVTVPGWPLKTFAPYIDILSWPTLDISAIARTQRVLRYTLAFIVADSSKLPSWGGVIPLSQNFYATQIQNLRAQGGDVIISFGGASGQELGTVLNTYCQLKDAYQSVINRYNVTWADFDIEGYSISNKTSVDIRNQALSVIKRTNPGLKISYTLPVNPTGLTADGVYLIQSAVKYGLDLDVINLMTMDFATSLAPNGATGMGGYAIQAANAVYAQAQLAGLKSISIGITPMVC